MSRPASAPLPRSGRHEATEGPDDLTLVTAAQRGDRVAYEVLMRRYAGGALALAEQIVADPMDADDVCQVAMVRCWERLSQCRDGARFRGWFLAVVRSVGYDHHRRVRRRRTDRLDATHDVALPVPDGDRGADLHRALATLSAVQREVLLLADLEDLPHKEIARMLGLSEFMSRRHLSDARRRMRAALTRIREVSDDR